MNKRKLINELRELVSGECISLTDEHVKLLKKYGWEPQATGQSKVNSIVLALDEQRYKELKASLQFLPPINDKILLLIVVEKSARELLKP